MESDTCERKMDRNFGESFRPILAESAIEILELLSPKHTVKLLEFTWEVVDRIVTDLIIDTHGRLLLCMYIQSQQHQFPPSITLPRSAKVRQHLTGLLLP